MDDPNTTTTRLLTALNISATKNGKRRWATEEEEAAPKAAKLNKRKAARVADAEVVAELTTSSSKDDATMDDTTQNNEMTQNNDTGEGDDDSSDPYEDHFGPSTSVLNQASRLAIEQKSWKQRRAKRGKLGLVCESLPEGSKESDPSKPAVYDKLYRPFVERQMKQSRDQSALQTDILTCLSNYQDLYISSSPWETKRRTREAISLHILSHISKKRRRILKNNERLAHAIKSNLDAPENVQDQGFTRPSVLVLLPFRSSALAWFHALSSHTQPPAFQIENQARFVSEYGLPPNAVDKLASADPGTYPKDHVETFKGNVDDNFRVGIKMNRKSVKMFSDFYSCDIIMASPLGLRRSIEKEKHADYLSSIEVLVIDQLESLTMQNWEHVKFVMSNLNKMPKESHDADFSRIKPWYLDGHSEFLRQSILLTAVETPETRALYASNLKNVAGKIRTEIRHAPLDVPAGIQPSFVQFLCNGPQDEDDKRFAHFTTQLLPAVLKSAVQSSGTVILVPSSFDFIRVRNYLKKESDVTFAMLSEYSSNQDISRARQSFFSGNSPFLLVSERFHFYKRYKIRGIRNIIFYGPPENSQFFSEFLTFPFLDEGVLGEDVSCKVLYSKLDWFRLERIVGTGGAQGLIKAAI